MKTGWLDVDGYFEVIGERGKEAHMYAVNELKKLKKEGGERMGNLRFPLFGITKRCINDRLRGEAEEKLRKIDEEIKRIEEEVENSNRAIILKFFEEIKESFEEVRYNATEKNSEESVRKIVDACEKLENCAKEMRIILETYLIDK